MRKTCRAWVSTFVDPGSPRSCLACDHTLPLHLPPLCTIVKRLIFLRGVLCIDKPRCSNIIPKCIWSFDICPKFLVIHIYDRSPRKSRRSCGNIWQWNRMWPQLCQDTTSVAWLWMPSLSSTVWSQRLHPGRRSLQGTSTNKALKTWRSASINSDSATIAISSRTSLQDTKFVSSKMPILSTSSKCRDQVPREHLPHCNWSERVCFHFKLMPICRRYLRITSKRQCQNLAGK